VGVVRVTSGVVDAAVGVVPVDDDNDKQEGVAGAATLLFGGKISSALLMGVVGVVVPVRVGVGRHMVMMY
jgi:hypothetical protein